jgi:hypothetical protein
VALAAALSLAPSLAFAQPAPGTRALAPDARAPAAPGSASPPPASGHAALPLARSLTGPAKADFDSAEILFNNGDYARAMLKYGQAYDASHDARLLMNMAVCARELHDYARMQALLARYRHDGAAVMSAEEAAQVDGALRAIHDLVGLVGVTVSEPGAAVEVDGDAMGNSPLEAPVVLNLGRHKITVRKEGFELAEQAVDVRGGTEVARVQITLRARVATGEAAAPANGPGHLLVVADAEASIAIDRAAPVRGRFDGAVAPGPHEVRVTEAGKAPYGADVDVRPGETRTLSVSLSDEKRAGGAGWWPWALGGAAAVAGVVVGGYFLFHSSSPAAAPQPTDTWGSVHVAGFSR